jgi:acid phosphatase type 7
VATVRAVILAGLLGCGGTITAHPGEPLAGDGGVEAWLPVDGGPEADGGAARTLRVVVVSDLNGSYGSTTYGAAVHGAVARILDLAPDLVLATGDLVAGQQAGLPYAAMWEGFHAAVSDPLARAGIPLAVTPGNHDASGYAAFASERAIFVGQWLPRRPDVSFVDDSDYPLRYSFVEGPVLFISLDATTIGPLAAEQRAWVAEQLVAAAELPVKIVYGHVPLHPFTQERETEVLADRRLEDLLLEHGVTLFISGHHHAYYPGRHDGVRVVSMPCLGSGPRRLIGDSATSRRGVLLLELSAGGVTSLEALDEPSFTRVIPRASLPARLTHGGVTVTRDDL